MVVITVSVRIAKLPVVLRFTGLGPAAVALVTKIKALRINIKITPVNIHRSLSVETA